MKWTGKLNFEDYQPAQESASWYKPQMRISSDLLFNVTDKIALNASVAIQDASKAKLYTVAPASPYVIPDPNNETVVSVKGFVDLGVGASYKINNKFSAFARANNLFNSSYSRYLYYPTIGTNIFGGLTYSF